MIRPIGFCATLRAAMIAAGLLLSGGTAALVTLAVAPATAAGAASGMISLKMRRKVPAPRIRPISSRLGSRLARVV